MLIKCLTVGQIETNCYIAADPDTLECAVIDPGDESNTIMDYLEDQKLRAKYIFLTHGHFDHTMAALAVREQTGARVCMSKKDVAVASGSQYFLFEPPADTIFYGEGDRFQVGSLTFTVMETPGHTPGGVCLLCGDAIFSGDTLFRESCGRTDLPGGDMAALLKSLKRLYDLPGEYDVYPGHMEPTTLGRERTFNYYMKYANETAR